MASVDITGNKTEIARHIFAYGCPCDKIYGFMNLQPDGRVVGYTHHNESSWQLSDDGKLSFISAEGKVTSELLPESPNVWLGHVVGQRFPLMLVSVLKNDAGTDGPSVIINTIPKAGTYFMEAALGKCGFPSARLHLLDGNVVDDYRGIPEKEMHRNPEKQRIRLPLELIPCITRGQTCEAHVHDPAVIGGMTRNGGHVIHIKRNLRNVVVSLYRFKLNRVDPLDEMDSIWRKLEEPNRFIKFMEYFSELDLAHVRDMAVYMSSLPSISYEDMVSGIIPPHMKSVLDDIRPGLASELSNSLMATRNTETPTKSAKSSDWHELWSRKVQRVFVDLGLEDANLRLGYKSRWSLF